MSDARRGDDDDDDGLAGAGSALRGAMSGAPSTSSAAMQAKLVRGRRWWWCGCGCGCGLVVG